MSRLAIFAGLVGLVGLAGCITPDRHREVMSANGAFRDQVADLKRVNKQYQEENARLLAEVNRMTPLVKDAAALDLQKKQVEAILKGLKDSGPTGSELPAGVTTLQTSDGLIVRVEGSVLFASGSAKLSKVGQGTLKKLSSAIAEHSGGIRVAGHTDSDKIKHSNWKTNMRLSVARGLAVLEFLQNAGVVEEHMSVAGYGPHAPVDEADKARNRRVEIVLLKPR
ncbi:MAG: OmpA family protein [Planctomycetota bacterium]|nr:OmpA family protein [Planctomycetota bacterium]